MKNIIFFGPPGAGKGTQAKLISNKLNIPHYSTGDILRSKIKEKDSLAIKLKEIMSSGKLVSDEILNSIVASRLINSFDDGFILDGYPRTLTQAKNLDILLKKYQQKIDIVLKLNVSLETIKKRISERKSIEKRADDNEEIAIKRFQTYEKSSEPVLDYYRQTKLLKVVNGENSISQINNEISGLIDGI